MALNGIQIHGRGTPVTMNRPKSYVGPTVPPPGGGE
eukprot:gene13172-15528_t